jgi:hypothetical protein
VRRWPLPIRAARRFLELWAVWDPAQTAACVSCLIFGAGVRQLRTKLHMLVLTQIALASAVTTKKYGGTAAIRCHTRVRGAVARFR